MTTRPNCPSQMRLQQAVQWLQMCFWVIFPYCFVRLCYMSRFLPTRKHEGV